MKQIPLTRGFYALVDDEEFGWISKWKWLVQTRITKNSTRRYAARFVWVNSLKRPICIYMHREILGAKTGQLVDHVNGDGLNNSKSNIRLCTQSQNMAAKRVLRPVRSSIYRGVRKRSGSSKFEAKIVFKGKSIYLGMFTTEELAATAYNVASQKYFGKFATNNQV